MLPVPVVSTAGSLSATPQREVMGEPLVAWAGDCMVRGVVELGDGRLSDQVNELDVVRFYAATLRALDDGHEVTVDELDVERGELHVRRAPIRSPRCRAGHRSCR